MLKYMESNNTSVHYLTSNCYTNMKRYDVFKEKDIANRSLPFIANCIISKIKFPAILYNDFLKCMIDLNKKKCNIIDKFIKNENENKKITSPERKYVYGIDEFFLYLALSEYLVKMNIKYSCTLFNNARTILRNIYDYSEGFKNEDEYRDLVKGILGKYYKDKLSVKKNFNNLTMNIILDNINFNIGTEKEKYYSYIFLNILNIFSKFDLSKLPYGLKKSDIDCIVSYPEFKLQNKTFNKNI